MIVRGQHGGDAVTLLQQTNLSPDLHPKLRIEHGERFVHQEYLWRPHERTRRLDELLMAGRQFARPVSEQVLDLEHTSLGLDPCIDLVGRSLAKLEREGDVVPDIEKRVQHMLLEHHRHIAFGRSDGRHVDPVESNRSGADRLETGDRTQQHRLSGTGRAEHDEQFAVGHLQVIDVENQIGSPDDLDVVERDDGHLGFPNGWYRASDHQVARSVPERAIRGVTDGVEIVRRRVRVAGDRCRATRAVGWRRRPRGPSSRATRRRRAGRRSGSSSISDRCAAARAGRCSRRAAHER